MKTTRMFIARFILLGLVIPILLSIIVYEGFATNYTLGIFSKQGFDLQYDKGVYRYRILGKAALVTTYDLIQRYHLPTIDVPSSLYILDPNAEEQFYSAYFYLNTFFLCLTCIVLFLLLHEKSRDADFLSVDVPLLMLCFVMTIAQYAVVPYDTLSNFLLAVSVFIISHNNHKTWEILLLCMIVAMATLVRETAFLIIAFDIAVNYDVMTQRNSKPFRFNREQGIFLLIFASFIFTYLGVRVSLGYDQSIINSISNGFRLLDNLTSVYAIFGMAFLLSIVLLLLTTKFVAKEMILFLQLSSPYVLFVLLAANPWEIRLWTPLILVLVIMKVRTSQMSLSPISS